MTAILGAVVVAVLLLSTAWIMSGMSRPHVTIVAIVPLSGASSYLVEIGDAMSIMTEKLNRWGGINGMQIRLITMDCASSPEFAVDQLLRAEEEYHPLAVVTATRGAAVPMSAIAEENGIVMISVGATMENLTEGKDWIFRYYVTPSGEAENAIDVLERFEVESLGILHLDDAYGDPMNDQVVADFEAKGGSVESYGFAPDRTEFSELVANVSGCDAVFAVALRHQYQAILQELNSSGHTGLVMCAVEASIPEMWQYPCAQGCYVSAPIMYGSSAAVDSEFLQEFEDRYDVPLTHQGAIGADALRLIWGLLSDSEVSRDNLRELLSSGFIYSGILGVIQVEQGAHNADISVYPAMIEGGGLTYL